MVLISIQVRELQVATNLCKRGFALILLEETRLVLVEFVELAPQVIKVEGVVLYGICFGLLRALGSTFGSRHGGLAVQGKKRLSNVTPQPVYRVCANAARDARAAGLMSSPIELMFRASIHRMTPPRPFKTDIPFLDLT